MIVYIPSVLAVYASLLVTASPLSPAACGETGDRLCYGVNNGGTAQAVSIDDVAIAALSLRATAKAAPDTMWIMPPDVDCAEWTILLPSGLGVLILAKHINPRTNSSVLYSDIANTIDGGDKATEEDEKKSLLGCAENGGQMGILVDKSSPYYNTEDYKKYKNKPEGIVIKVVKKPA